MSMAKPAANTRVARLENFRLLSRITRQEWLKVFNHSICPKGNQKAEKPRAGQKPAGRRVAASPELISHNYRPHAPWSLQRADADRLLHLQRGDVIVVEQVVEPLAMKAVFVVAVVMTIGTGWVHLI